MNMTSNLTFVIHKYSATRNKHFCQRYTPPGWQGILSFKTNVWIGRYSLP
jgi:hypothetical protein